MSKAGIKPNKRTKGPTKSERKLQARLAGHAKAVEAATKARGYDMSKAFTAPGSRNKKKN